MPYDQHQFNPEWIKARATKMRANLINNRPGREPMEFALENFANRLAQDGRRYLDYGPWWWTLKDQLNRAGYEMGASMDQEILAAYRFDDPYETLVAAETFREENLKHRPLYTNRYLLDGESGEWYTLHDPDR